MTSSTGEDITSDPNVHNAEKSGLCIGSIFGLDVGGTLAKLVYFEKHEHTRHGQEYDTGKEPRVHIHSKVGAQDSHSNEDLTKLLRARQASLPDALIQFHEQDSNKYDDIDQMRKSKSMFNLVDGDERAIALSKFYTFAKNLDSYASGVKENDLSFYSRALGGEFHFIQFETRQMPVALELIRISSFHRNILHIGATGGGAHRFSNEFEQILGIKMVKQDELDSMVAGLQFALRDCPNECYTFVPDEDAIRRSESGSNESLIENVESSPAANDLEESLVTSHRPPRRRWRDSDQYWWSKKELRDSSSTAKQYPYLLVMIGTGVSILRVDGPRKHERISGSTIGGGTYWGLCRLLTDAEDFQSALELAKRGDATKVDMLVGDIYGPNSGALEKLGLSANIVASSFGKLVSKQSPAEGLSQMDLARALLLMVTNNIGQVALLNARLHNTQRIYFIGNFLRHNIISQQRLAISLAYWSKGKMEALFLEHEGYFGSLGAFLLSQGINTSKLPSSVSSDPRREFKSTRDIKHVRRYRARSI
jgi:type II pantothenate kinase